MVIVEDVTYRRCNVFFDVHWIGGYWSQGYLRAWECDLWERSCQDSWTSPAGVGSWNYEARVDSKNASDKPRISACVVKRHSALTSMRYRTLLNGEDEDCLTAPASIAPLDRQNDLLFRGVG